MKSVRRSGSPGRSLRAVAPFDGGHWLFEIATNSSNPSGVDVSSPGEGFALSRDGTILSSAPEWYEVDAIANGTTSHLGQTDASSPLWIPNQWIETRIHYDTSGPTGVYEVWTRTTGSPWSVSRSVRHARAAARERGRPPRSPTPAHTHDALQHAYRGPTGSQFACPGRSAAHRVLIPAMCSAGQGSIAFSSRIWFSRSWIPCPGGSSAST